MRHIHVPTLNVGASWSPSFRDLDSSRNTARSTSVMWPRPLAAGAHAGGVVEGEGVGVADMRLAGAGEQQAQQRCDVGDGADRGARTAAEALLVHHDRGGQVLDQVDLGVAVAGKE